MSEIKYTIKKESKDKDIMKAVIEKTGHSVDLTLTDVVRHIFDLTKLKKEQQTTFYVGRAYMDNMEKHNKYLKNLTEQDKSTLFLYGEKWRETKEAEEILEEISKQIGRYRDLIKGLVEQIGLPADSEIHKAIKEFEQTESEAKVAYKKIAGKDAKKVSK